MFASVTCHQTQSEMQIFLRLVSVNQFVFGGKGGGGNFEIPWFLLNLDRKVKSKLLRIKSTLMPVFWLFMDTLCDIYFRGKTLFDRPQMSTEKVRDLHFELLWIPYHSARCTLFSFQTTAVVPGVSKNQKKNLLSYCANNQPKLKETSNNLQKPSKMTSFW